MEALFTTVIRINNRDVSYHVFFDNEQYQFQPEQSGSDTPGFSFVREHDEWHCQQGLTEEIKTQAMEALEKYLMKQH
jgi:hypothetical protein